MSPVAAHLAATSVVLLHLAYVVFVLVGGFLAWHWRPVIYAHVPAVVWGVYVEWSGRICPLTPIENSLRAAAGLAPYSGDFIAHYVFPLLYPEGLTRGVQFALGVFALIVNGVAYGVIIRRRRAAHARPRGLRRH
jgi:hypothetical protein